MMEVQIKLRKWELWRKNEWAEVSDLSTGGWIFGRWPQRVSFCLLTKWAQNEHLVKTSIHLSSLSFWWPPNIPDGIPNEGQLKKLVTSAAEASSVAGLLLPLCSCCCTKVFALFLQLGPLPLHLGPTQNSKSRSAKYLGYLNFWWLWPFASHHQLLHSSLFWPPVWASICLQFCLWVQTSKKQSNWSAKYLGYLQF